MERFLSTLKKLFCQSPLFVIQNIRYGIANQMSHIICNDILIMIPQSRGEKKDEILQPYSDHFTYCETLHC
jgi:hypothetical protein